MKYTILFIEESENLNKGDNLSLELLEDSEVLFVNSRELIIELFKAHDIHLIVIDTKILNLSILTEVLSELSINYDEIPILILGQYDKDIIEDNKLFIYDFIDLELHEKVLINKINFCKSLYSKELNHKKNIKKLLYTDNLTQLPNRTKLIQDIRNDEIGVNSIAIIDINSFKEINDFFGHRIGDNILKSVATLIEEMITHVKNKVLLYKFSADVYCLANIDLPKEIFEDIVVYTLGSIKSEIYREDQHEIDISATAGVTFSPKNNKLITADLALNAAKKENKDYVVFYDELDNFREYQNNMLWTKKLKNALDKDNIIVYFQPLVNNETLNVDKYECLVRMIDEDKVIAPFFFLEVSKKANQYRNITKIVIEKSFKEFENLDFEFSVNVSYEDIEDKNFIYFIKDRLKKYKVAHKVVWEILEDEGIKNYDVLFNFINEVKSLGCKVAIDDFGSGYSNFEHLLKMDVDYLKIDASLVKNVATSESSYKVVRTIIEFAKSLNLKTISEYVENKEIFDVVKELGSTYSQGYLFSAPVSKPDIYSYPHFKE
ncbi:MAG: GGDEF-domain containing protein [Epsilonproteobacteria bacterium]|nr:MAG: GGDEF-domain containing protein [Campylobacterota bacterium]